MASSEKDESKSPVASRVVKVQFRDQVRRVSMPESSRPDDIRALCQQLFADLQDTEYEVALRVETDSYQMITTELLSKAFENEPDKALKFLVRLKVEVEEDDAWDLVDIDDEQASQSSSLKDASVSLAVETPVHISHPNWISVSDTNPQDSDEKTFHIVGHNVFCDECSKSITGARYKCFYCEPMYNLCGICEETVEHDPLHPFIKIKTPTQCPDHGTIACQKRNKGLVVVSNIGLRSGSVVAPGEAFFAGWRLKNIYGEQWEEGCFLRCAGGSTMGYDDEKQKVAIPAAHPQEIVDVLVELKAPDKTGRWKGIWRACNSKGEFFGTPLFISVDVQDSQA